MIELEDIPNGRGRGFVLNKAGGYDETISIDKPIGYNTIIIATGNGKAEENWWNVVLERDHAIAIARHLLTLVRDMD